SGQGLIAPARDHIHMRSLFRGDLRKRFFFFQNFFHDLHFEFSCVGFSNRCHLFFPHLETSVFFVLIYGFIIVGWQFSTVMLLPEQPSSWGAILSQRRIATKETAVSVGIEQLEALRPLLPTSVRLLADRWYATGPFLQACQRLQMPTLMRLKRNRKLYRPAP